MKFKNFTLLLLSCILSINSFSQLSITKQKDIGGNNDEYFGCMNSTIDGGLIVGGSSSSNISGNKTENSKGLGDYWIIKLDSLHVIQWDKTIGGNNSDLLTAIEQTTDGGYVLGGYSSSDSGGDKTDKRKGNDDYWIVKLDSLGNKKWDKTIGGKAYSFTILTSLQQTDDGGYIIGGYSDSDSSGNKTQNSKGQNDYWIVKLDGSGNIQWDKTIGGSKDDYLRTLQQTSDGGYILGGESYSKISGDKTENSTKWDYWILKLDNSGNIQWDKTLGGSSGDDCYCIKQISNGNYLVGGVSYSGKNGNKHDTSRGAGDYWILCLNGLGHLQWDKTIGGNSDDYLKSMEQTTDGGYILGGYSASNISGEKKQNSLGGYDYWMVKLDQNHEIEWSKTIGGSGTDFLLSVKETKKNNYILGGYSNSPVSGNKTKPLIGGYDYWLLYTDYKPKKNSINSDEILSGSQSATPIIKNFSAYPNPVKDILSVQSKTKAVFSLTDQSGKTILTKTINGNGKINVADITPGLYYLNNNETGMSQKILVIK